MFRLSVLADAFTVIEVSRYGKFNSTDFFNVDPLPELEDALLSDTLLSQLKDMKIVINDKRVAVVILKVRFDLRKLQLISILS